MVGKWQISGRLKWKMFLKKKQLNLKKNEGKHFIFLCKRATNHKS